MDEPGPAPRVLLADKRYDADFILADLEARGVAAVIPAKRNRNVQPVIHTTSTASETLSSDPPQSSDIAGGWPSDTPKAL